LKAQFSAIGAELQQAVARVLEGQQFILGPEVEELERQVAQYSGCEAGVGVSSGTDALLCCLMCLGVGPGDEVITTPYSFFATAGSIWRLGARPVFVDIEPDTYNLDPGLVAAAVTGRTRAILPVHLFGQTADMDPLLELSREHGLAIIEDAAQSIGARYQGRPAGSLGTAGCLSFFPSKNLGGAGDGGMIVTRDAALASKLVVQRAHGAKPKYFHQVVGGNFRLDAIQAAVLLVKLRYLDQWSSRRRANAARYAELLGDIQEVSLPAVRPHCESVFNQFVIRISRRDALREFLGQQGVSTAIYYPRPLHLQQCFASLGHRPGDFPHAELAAEQTLALPIFPELTDEQLTHVADSIRQFCDV